MSTGIETDNAGKPQRRWKQPRNLTQLWLEGWEMGELRNTFGETAAENAVRDYVARRLGLGPLRFGRREKLRRGEAGMGKHRRVEVLRGMPFSQVTVRCPCGRGISFPYVTSGALPPIGVLAAKLRLEGWKITDDGDFCSMACLAAHGPAICSSSRPVGLRKWVEKSKRSRARARRRK